MRNARQMKVKGILETLSFHSFMKEKEIDDQSDGFAKLVEHVSEI